jgi:hypothetical protein
MARLIIRDGAPATIPRLGPTGNQMISGAGAMTAAVEVGQPSSLPGAAYAGGEHGGEQTCAPNGLNCIQRL